MKVASDLRTFQNREWRIIEISLLRVIPTLGFQGTYSDIYSDILPNILSDIYSDILFAILSGILSAISSKILWGRSGWEHSDPELAVRVLRGTLRSSACS